MNKLNKTESAVFVSLKCSLVPGDLHSKLLLNYWNEVLGLNSFMLEGPLKGTLANNADLDQMPQCDVCLKY